MKGLYWDVLLTMEIEHLRTIRAKSNDELKLQAERMLSVSGLKIDEYEQVWDGTRLVARIEG